MLKIKYRSTQIPARYKTETFDQFFERCLDGYNIGNTKINNIESSFDRTSEAIGRLVRTLAEKKLLTREEVYEIATGNVWGSEIGIDLVD